MDRRNATEQELQEIQTEYEKMLVLPAIKPKKQWLLMPVGLIGSGKTTVVKPLAECLHLLRLCTDDVRKIMKERGFSYEGCRDIIANLQRKYLSLGYSIALDANNGGAHGLMYNARTKEAFPNIPQVFVYIDPPEEYIINKLKNYDHTWLFKDAEEALRAHVKNKENFVVPDLNFEYTFDPSRDDLQAQIEQCVKKLEAVIVTL